MMARSAPVTLRSLVLQSSASSPYKGTGALEHSSLLQFCSSPSRTTGAGFGRSDDRLQFGCKSSANGNRGEVPSPKQLTLS